jgi:hypothetical protein
MCPSGLSWWVQCTNKSCGMATKIAYSDEPVISAWNNRAAPVPPSQEARDAERYRYIRDNAKDGAVKTLLPLYRAHYFVSLEPVSAYPTFDAAIDAAILAAKEKK